MASQASVGVGSLTQAEVSGPSVAEAASRSAIALLPRPSHPMEMVRQFPGGLCPGRAYRVEEGSRAREIFSALVARGLAGLRMTRDLPGDGPGNTIEVLRLGSGPGASISRPEQLAAAVEGFCGRRKSAVLFEGLGYLSVHFGFEVAFRALAALRDVAAATGSVLLVPYPAAAFSEHERALLAGELEPLEGDGRLALWETRAAGLFSDEKALYDLIRAAGGQKHQADLVTETGFSKARVSRVLTRMEQKGLLRRQRDGMGNLVALASER